MLHAGEGSMRIDVLTLFPGMCQAVLRAGVVGRAFERGRLRVVLSDLRHFAGGRHGSVDDAPFGGGSGMVLRVEPAVEAVESVRIEGAPVILTSPQGRRFAQSDADRLAEELQKREQLVFLCGRYKGFDERVRDLVVTDEFSLGDFVVSGGELPALVMIDAIVRRLPGVLGRAESAETDSFGPGREGMLDVAYYTRPQEYRGRTVPEVLLSGDHGKIEEWRRESSRERTLRRRPDLVNRIECSDQAATRRARPTRDTHVRSDEP
jgi:tRNA (guanine37-N1)-methyltransferase